VHFSQSSRADCRSHPPFCVLVSFANMRVSIATLFTPIPYWTSTRVSSVLEIVLLIIARLVMLFASLLCTGSFIGALMWYKDEPVLHLADYMYSEDFPTVDIFLPRYKEDWDLYRPTVEAALALDYPKHRFTANVLDDGSRLKPVRELLEPLMQQHPNLQSITRPDGKDAKAGNLNNALRQTHNTLVVVLDADHRCRPDFLLRMAPHLLAVEDGRRMPWLCTLPAWHPADSTFSTKFPSIAHPSSHHVADSNV
jgi:hypothetical protein